MHPTRARLVMIGIACAGAFVVAFPVARVTVYRQPPNYGRPEGVPPPRSSGEMLAGQGHPAPTRPAREDDEAAANVNMLASAERHESQRAQRKLIVIGAAGVPALLKAVSDKRANVREGAHNVLSTLSGKGFAQALLRSCEVPTLAEQAYDWMERLKTDEEAEPIATAALDTACPYPRRKTLIAVLSRLPAAAAREAVLRLSSDSDPRIRCAALRSLYRLEGEEVTRRLIEAVGDTSREVARQAIESLGKRKAVEAVDVLCDIIAKPKKEEAAHFAVTALGRIGSREAVPALVAALAAPEGAFSSAGEADAFRRGVAEALGALTGLDFGTNAARWHGWMQQAAGAVER